MSKMGAKVESRSSPTFDEKKKSSSKQKISLGGGKVREGRMHGTPKDDVKQRSRSSSRPRNANKPRKQYDTPFDDKGRCHYHKNVQLAAKKMGGGWKVLHSLCPKCMEEGDCDDRSVRSGGSRKSTGKSKSEVTNAQGQFDKNGCCILHTHIQVAKKKVLGNWKVRNLYAILLCKIIVPMQDAPFSSLPTLDTNARLSLPLSLRCFRS